MSETTTRLWVASFVVVVFVCGLALGVAMTGWIGPDRPGPPAFFGPPPAPPPGADMARGFSERIFERLEADPEFSDEQRQRLEQLFAERRDRFRQFNQEMRARFENERNRLRDDMAAILTPGQMEILDEARRERRRGPRGPRGSDRPDPGRRRPQ